MNEEGTEAAAAATAQEKVYGLFSPPPPKRFVADHPFMFAVMEKRQKIILFIGHVTKIS